MTPRQRAETLLARAAAALCRRLGPVRASNLGGWLARGVGPMLPVSRVADANLRRALPGLDAAARRATVRAIWDNLGRTVAELPFVARLVPSIGSAPGWELTGEAIIADQVAAGGRAILFAAHCANWEVLFAAASYHGLSMGGFYRAAANPGIDALMRALRTPIDRPAAPMFAKGAAGAKAALAFLRDGGVLGFLMDQKMNDGIAADFFGQPAMTAPALASLALRFRCPVIPCQVQRLGPARFHLNVLPPVVLPDSGDKAADVEALTQIVNDMIESWVRARPGEWLWLHRRWPSSTQV